VYVTVHNEIEADMHKLRHLNWTGLFRAQWAYDVLAYLRRSRLCVGMLSTIDFHPVNGVT
jgi:hypothetical protein